MKEFIRNSILALVTGLLVISVSGVNIFIHHCSCKDLKYATAIPSSTCCDHREDLSGCCTTRPPEPSCCSKTENSSPNTTHISKTKCCTKEHYFVKLVTDLDQQIKKDHIRLFVFAVPDARPDVPSHSLISGKPFQYDSSPPIPLSGRELLDLLHQRRLDC
ncbi:MAG: hypothetical protein PHD25_01465 [Bacteroidales bacterium]|nr:hypothetical protein [Bacteroidales bacterium]